MHSTIHAVGHQYAHCKKQGLHKRANAYLIIGMGCIFLPFPIIGIPVILWGIVALHAARREGGGH